MYNRQELKAVMARFDDTQEQLADALKTTSAILSAKINGKRDFKRNDIEVIALRYSLLPDELWRIFFANDVELKETM